MSNLMASTKLYLSQRLQELDINDVSELVQYLDTFNENIDDKNLAKVKTEDEDNVVDLLCFLPPLLTALMCVKELEKVNVKLQTNGIISKSISRKKSWLENISWEPRVFVYHNFLTNEECEHLISLAKPNMVRSKMGYNLNGGGYITSTRTSTGTHLSRGQDKIVEEIEKRISEFTFVPIENGEGLQVILYQVGQKFDRHNDGYDRIATVLMYLSDVEEGGETVFPDAKGNNGKRGISISPKKGDAVFFWNMKPNGTQDPFSMHSSSPIIKGNKWACTKWFRHHEFLPIHNVGSTDTLVHSNLASRKRLRDWNGTGTVDVLAEKRQKLLTKYWKDRNLGRFQKASTKK